MSSSPTHAASSDFAATGDDMPPMHVSTSSIAKAITDAQAHAQAGRLDEARRLLRDVIMQSPEHVDALSGLAYLTMRRGHDIDAFTEAARWFDRALAAQSARPGISGTQERIGLLRDAAFTHQHAGNLIQSRTLLVELLTLAPTPENLLALAMGHIALQELDAAQSLLERAIRAQPNAWELHYNKGRLLGMRGRYDDEIAAYRHALRLAPNAVPVHVNLGVALRDLHRFDDAMQAFKRAAQLDPSSAAARTNRAQTNLMRGEFEHGWREYEWRWREGPPTRPAFADDRNQWDGKAALAGKTILLFAEQGFGDTMQFARLALDVAHRKPARIVMRVQAALASLFLQSPRFADAGIEILSDDAPVPLFDVQAALMSLPHLLNLRVQTIPAPIPYLSVPAASAAGLSTKITAPTTTHRKRIGLVWRGNPHHVNDANRSTTLAQWEAMLRATHTGIEWTALHDRVPDVEQPLLQRLHEADVLRDVRPALTSFADTAREIAELDLVISVDSAVAHLAGAMGKPVWVVLPFTPDYRWLLDRADTPWYPQARLFRQTHRGEWVPVFEEIERALAS
ncbi:tetratricopeptide repeat protein [Robbsia andropogonis]|nr:tetratricopeptide repeat protein [Robbsia andropogonis]